MKFVFICSTSGSVIKKAFDYYPAAFKNVLLISDRHCGAIEFAKKRGFDYNVYETHCSLSFSNYIADIFLDEKEVVFFSFYTRLFKGRFITENSGRLVNFHPSILPACPGQDGFGDTIKSGAFFIGSTVHFIDEGVDSGTPILQAAYPRNPNVTLEKLRHRVFLQQVISLIQVAKWYSERRILREDGVLKIKNAKYDVSEFSPNIDADLFRLFEKLDD